MKFDPRDTWGQRDGIGMKCKHIWEVADVTVKEIYNGIDVDFQEEIILICQECGRGKVVDEINYRAMSSYGLIKNRKINEEDDKHDE